MPVSFGRGEWDLGMSGVLHEGGVVAVLWPEAEERSKNDARVADSSSWVKR